ncbi:hypothetical protein DsansV1_C09g0094681 [Dioscorea sansibarensis]
MCCDRVWTRGSQTGWGKVTLVDIMVSRGDEGAFALDKHMESLLAKHLQTGYTICAGTKYMPHHEFILT